MKYLYFGKAFVGAVLGLSLLTSCNSSTSIKDNLSFFSTDSVYPTSTPSKTPKSKPTENTKDSKNSANKEENNDDISIKDLFNKAFDPKSAVPTIKKSKDITLKQLKEYDGKYGRAAYIAVNGMIYDLTNAKDWKNGKLKKLSIKPGLDNTKEVMRSPQKLELLDDIPVIGLIVK